ncbi:EAL domain-containing protein [Brevibacillus sp. SYP-B805]|uniref:EAL domain-containing protein n=1 Tax=Brevibacillus sp. SYP-B805 TaxID=1578199 RepID=UPI0013EDE998|nr:EAL domain-containing protein [Brevibacillus sp. SYP-B805]NGQ96409.1 EAL domain-containing protein [Brevibacillus sp. SYP-B805]
MESITGAIDFSLAALSFLIAVLAIYTMMDIFDRLQMTKGRPRLFWIGCGTVIGGIGISLLPYIGMIAFHPHAPERVDAEMFLYSLLFSHVTILMMQIGFLLPVRPLAKSLIGSFTAGGGFTLLHCLVILSAEPLHQIGLLQTGLNFGSMSLLMLILMRCVLYKEGESVSASMRRRAAAAVSIGMAMAVLQFANWRNVEFGRVAGTLFPAAFTLDQAQVLAFGEVTTVAIFTFQLLAAYMDRRKALQMARLKNIQYESLFQHNPHLVCLLDLEGRFLSGNPAVEAITGFRPEELSALFYRQVLWPENEERIAHHLAKVKNGETQQFEVTIRHKMGHPLDLHVTCFPMLVDGSVVGIFAIAEDVTERKKMEEALRESEARYRLIAENMSDIFCIYGIDGTVRYASPSYRSLFVEPAESYIGKNVLDFLHPDEVPRMQQMNRTLLETKSTQYFECRFRHHDGTCIHIEASAIPVTDADGRVDSVAVLARDITQRKLAERRLEESEQRYRSLFEHNTDAVFAFNTRGHLTSVNPAVKEITGYEPEEMLNKPFIQFVVPEEQAKAIRHYKQVRKGNIQNFEVSIRHKQGHSVTLHVNTVPIIIDQVPVGAFGIAKDITERKRAEQTINHLAYHDALTDLPNRRLFKKQLTAALEEAERSGKMLGVMFLDLDRFKLINDTLGHDIGDKLLITVAGHLKNCMGEGDMLARMGGDEFTVLLPALDSPDQAVRTAEKILGVFAQPFELNDLLLHVTTSIGIALYPQDGTDAESLMRHADMAMYRAKEQGKNRYQRFADVADAPGASSLLLENALHAAWEQKEFQLFFQPQLDIRTGRIIGMEALIRWQHPELGMLSPAEFVPLAEETGLILAINEWVLKEACRQVKRWQDDGYGELRMAVNLSTLQFQQPDFVGGVQRILEETGLPPDRLVLELKESAALYDVDHVNDKLRALRQMGIHIAIDDFGTGYSSLGRLRKFPIDSLKIDHSFVKDISAEPDSIAIIKAIVSMAHSLKLKVLAEGVETWEQIAVLEELGCHEAQGYLFSRPVSQEEASRLLAGALPNWVR